MNVGKINKKNDTKRILVAPLDWGLGHATRCIPLIKALIANGAEVVVAADGPIAALLRREFPTLVILRLKGYKVSYSSSKNYFFIKMLAQAPRILSMVKYEKSWLNHIISQYEIDAVISDNRFGFYTNKVPCVFITHQLFIETGNRFMNILSQKVNYKYINKFNECWVPDVSGPNNLAGKLSHPKKKPAIPVKYLGILSRCEKKEVSKEIDLLIMLSGPEPQRSVLENILLSQLNDVHGKVVFLRGLPAVQEALITGHKHVSVFNHLPATELNALILQSKLVIARCGYSTIMDLVALNQLAILIPTPGQTEQEYLAAYLKEKKLFYTVAQENFSLKQTLENIKGFNFSNFGGLSSMDERIIIDWLEKI